MKKNIIIRAILALICILIGLSCVACHAPNKSLKIQSEKEYADIEDLDEVLTEDKLIKLINEYVDELKKKNQTKKRGICAMIVADGECILNQQSVSFRKLLGIGSKIEKNENISTEDLEKQAAYYVKILNDNSYKKLQEERKAKKNNEQKALAEKKNERVNKLPFEFTDFRVESGGHRNVLFIVKFTIKNTADKTRFIAINDFSIKKDGYNVIEPDYQAGGFSDRPQNFTEGLKMYDMYPGDVIYAKLLFWNPDKDKHDPNGWVLRLKYNDSFTKLLNIN